MNAEPLRANPRVPALCRPAFLWALVVTGAALRIFQYASDTSFWFDEFSLVRNLVHMSPAQLATQPLKYDQVAPVGFLLAEKGISRVLGESDLAFRALLLPVSLAALVAFLFLARRVLDGYAVPFAVALFAIGAPFIRYSAEVKQYGIDMFGVILMFLLVLRMRDPGATVRRCVGAGLAGAVLVWFSQATILVLAGLGGALLLAWLVERDPRTGRALGIAVPIWAIACLAATVVAFRLVSPATREFMDTFWRLRGGFPPWPIEKPKDLLWLWDRTTQLFGDDMVLGYGWPALYVALAALGAILLWRRNRFVAFLLLGPFAAAVLAAAAQRYPFRTRLVLYVVPALVLFASQAAEGVRRAAGRIHPALGAVCMAGLLVSPVSAFFRVPPPYRVEDHKTMLAFVREHRRPGDAVFVYAYEAQALERYGPAYGLPESAYDLGGCSDEDRRVFLRDADRYRGRPRVWFIAGAVPPFQPWREAIEGYLGTIGVVREQIRIPSTTPLFPVSATLYDLSDPERLEKANADTFPIGLKPAAGDPRLILSVRCSDWVRRLR